MMAEDTGTLTEGAQLPAALVFVLLALAFQALPPRQTTPDMLPSHSIF